MEVSRGCVWETEFNDDLDNLAECRHAASLLLLLYSSLTVLRSTVKPACSIGAV